MPCTTPNEQKSADAQRARELINSTVARDLQGAFATHWARCQAAVAIDSGATVEAAVDRGFAAMDEFCRVAA